MEKETQSFAKAEELELELTDLENRDLPSAIAAEQATDIYCCCTCSCCC